jgi:hypothetical protein
MLCAAICFQVLAGTANCAEKAKLAPKHMVLVRTADDPFGPAANAGSPAVPPQADAEKKDDTGAATQPYHSRSVDAIKRALKETVNFNLGRVSLKDAIEYVGDKFKIEVQFDGNGLRDVAIDPTATPVDATVKNVALRSALDLMLSQFNLTFVIKDEVLLITSRDKASTMLETRLFDVRDIVMGAGENPTATFEPLLDAVRMSVNPPSWDINGGPCTLMSFNSNGICGLIVVQTYHGQEQVENLLAQLLRLKRPVAAAKPRPEMQFEHPAPGQTPIQIPQRSETPPETPPQSSNRQ